MNSFISSRGASPECVCTGKLAAAARGPHRVVDGSLYGVWSRHIVGIMIPPRCRACSASHSISATAALDVVGDRHERRRRRAARGLVAHSSTRNRLCARAPANASSGSSIVPGRQARAERRRLHAGDRVGVGEDHLGGDAVGVHLLVALLGVERAAQPFFVRRSPSCVM